MKMPSTLAKRPRLLPALVVGTLALGFAAVSVAADSDDAPHVVVRFSDLNLSSSAGAATLYGRIAAAALTVCEPSETSADMGPLFFYYHSWHKTCVHDAIARAVSKVGARQLSAIYNAKNHESH